MNEHIKTAIQHISNRFYLNLIVATTIVFVLSVVKHFEKTTVPMEPEVSVVADLLLIVVLTLHLSIGEFIIAFFHSIYKHKRQQKTERNEGEGK